MHLVCLIILSYKQHSEYPLIVAANRDEFYRRRAAPLQWWANGKILAGRDLGYATFAGRLAEGLGLRKKPDAGSWLGVNRQGRFAAVTNYRGATEGRASAAADREPGKESKSAKSRGLLIKRYLGDSISTADFAAELASARGEYNGFNLLFGTADGLFYFSNRNGHRATAIEPGLHVLSNAFLDTAWPKTERARSGFSALPGVPPESAAAFELLHDKTRATPETVQQTGLPLEIELALSSIFIAVPHYGTRVSSYLQFTSGGIVNFAERTYERGEFHSEENYSFKLRN